MKLLKVASRSSLVTSPSQRTSDQRLVTSDMFLLLLILLGILLRLTDLSIPEFSTDEAQLALGKSAAWTPLAMQIVVAVQKIFGFETIVARSVSVVIGIIALPIIFLITDYFSNKKTALLATAISAIFPSHILFSRLAYPSIYLSTAWLMTLLCFLKVKNSKNNLWLIGLFFSSVTATFLKSQGLIFPFLLLIGTIIEHIKTYNRNRIKMSNVECRLSNVDCRMSNADCLPVRSPPEAERRCGTKVGRMSIIVLVLSLIPVTLYIFTHPGILATVLLYGGNMYGVSGAFNRLMELIFTWKHILSFFAIFIIISIGWWKNLSWPLWTLLLTAILTGYLLGPSHEYYSTHLVILSIPIAIMLTKFKAIFRNLSLVVMTITTVLFLGPSNYSPFVHPLYKQKSYWNQNANKINQVLQNDKEVMIMGYPGHHLRWYLKPQLLLGRYMNAKKWNGKIIILKKDKLKSSDNANLIYEDENVIIINNLKSDY